MNNNTNRPYNKHSRPHNKNHKHNRGYNLDSLVVEALEFINKHQNNHTLFGCFHKRGNRMETFGIYNSKTKKHSIWYTTNFYPQDFVDLKEVALARK